MGIFQWLLSAQTLAGFALAIGLWILGKIIDRLLQFFIGKKIIRPILTKIKLHVRSFLTIIEPIEATFKITYSPRDTYTVEEIKSELKNAMTLTAEKSGNRIQGGEIRWNGADGRVEVEHREAKYPYKVNMDLTREDADRRENPDKPISQQRIREVNFEIHFEFPFPSLESEIPNIGTFASIFEDALDDIFYGISSEAQIVLHPIESDLSLDEWIEREQLDVSLLLAGSDDEVTNTQVEFFPDRVEVHPPYYELDSEVMRYIRILVMNYYLKQRTASNMLGIRNG